MPAIRHAVAAFATFATLSSLGAQAEGLPQVNLTVSWRLDTGLAARERQQAVGGQVILDSRGVIVGRTGVGATEVGTERQQASVQSVQVLNGRQARLFLGRQVGRQSWQLVWLPAAAGAASGAGSAPQPQMGLQSQTSWVDLGDGLVVRPRWAGGRQPVLLDVEARSQRAAPPGSVGAGFEPDGQVSRAEVASTLSVPLGEWVALASQGQAAQAPGRHTWSTRSLDDEASQTLWVRVSPSGRADAPIPLPAR